jgi:hypothetical protein
MVYICLLLLAKVSALNSSMNVQVPSPIWLPGMSTEPKHSGSALKALALNRTTDWSIWSWNKNPIVQQTGFSGLPITDPLIAEIATVGKIECGTIAGLLSGGADRCMALRTVDHLAGLLYMKVAEAQFAFFLAAHGGRDDFNPFVFCRFDVFAGAVQGIRQ